jgi:Concanavalin A-like lectin/glucanases superfamily/SPRY domain
MFSASKSAAPSGGYTINNSLRFRSSASAYLNRSTSAGNQQIFTFSAWVKYSIKGVDSSIFSAGALNNDLFFQFNTSSGTAEVFQIFGRNSSSTQFNLLTTQVFRDPSSWYHIVVAFDTTQATASNRIKFYVNGSQVTAFSTATYPAQNANININKASSSSYIGNGVGSLNYLDGYLAEVNFIDGQQLTPSSFGSTNSTTGVWQPAKYTGTYGTNGFYLNFSSIATTSGSNTGLGKDFSGNGNYWNTTNISVTAGTTYDAMLDVPTLTSATVANYPTLNPLSNTSTLAGANLDATNIVLSGSTMATPSSGKWYFEYTQTTSIPSGSVWVGVSSNLNAVPDNQLQGYSYATDGRKVAYNSYTSGYGATWTNGDVIGCAIDLDGATITFYKNGTSQGTAFTGITVQPYVFAISTGGTASTRGGSVNFGQRPFSYTPPSGYNALNTYNLPTSTIVQGNKYMDATLYTGTGSSLSLTNTAGFKPDFVWMKSRSAATDHALYDSVRGTTLELISDSTAVETTQSTGLTAFNTNGWTIGSETKVNTSAATYVGWQWQSGQGSTSSNTNGSITSTVSVNTTAGFSIVTYTGTGSNATVGHGLGVAPSMIIAKARGTPNGIARSWFVYHISLGAGKFIYLDLTSAAQTGSTVWQGVTPTSTVFSLGTEPSVNYSSSTYVAYCWAAIPGFSAFGSYTGNGSTDGPFIYLGFRPKYVMYKITSAANDWYIFDSSRGVYNLNNYYLYADSTAADGTTIGIDFLSNGFKQRNTDGGSNASGATYIYMAFAEVPTKFANAR